MRPGCRAKAAQSLVEQDPSTWVADVAVPNKNPAGNAMGARV
jgi:hypothetical protein